MKTLHKVTAISSILIVVALGTYLLVSSHAASPYSSTTATNGELSSGASQQYCSGASNGSCVVFGQTAPSIPMDGDVALALSSPGTPFSPTSFWNTQLPDNTPINPNTAAYQGDIDYDLQHYFGTPSNPNNGNINTMQYTVPFYVVPADQPLVPVNAACANNGTQKASRNFTPPKDLEKDVLGNGNGLPVPADAHGAAGTDEAIVIYQPSTNTEWELWQFQQDGSGNWEACDGGLNTDVSGGDGVFTSPYGVSASGLPLLGGLIRIEELQAGQIDHVMNLSLPQRLSRPTIPANTPGATIGYSYPAVRTDGNSTNPLEIAEGQRFRLPTCLHLPTDTQTCVSLSTYSQTYPLTPVAMTIAVAAQKYGFIVGDGAGAVDVRGGDPTPYITAGLPNPYTTGPGVGGVNNGNEGLFGADGAKQYLIMQNFPWDQLQALPYNYGEPQ